MVIDWAAEERCCSKFVHLETTTKLECQGSERQDKEEKSEFDSVLAACNQTSARVRCLWYTSRVLMKGDVFYSFIFFVSVHCTKMCSVCCT